jgi:RNA polymerase sigma-70 factor (ECF subfamily)
VLCGWHSAITSVTARDQVTQAFGEWRLDVYRYALSLGLDPAKAQEITQEAFLRLFMALDRGTEVAARKAWLFRVTHNLAIDTRMQESRMARWSPELTDRLVDSAVNPEQAVLEREKFARLQREVGRLSNQQQQCLHLRVAGLRYREIAAIIGIGTSTVSEFLDRAIEKLRKARHE